MIHINVLTFHKITHVSSFVNTFLCSFMISCIFFTFLSCSTKHKLHITKPAIFIEVSDFPYLCIIVTYRICNMKVIYYCTHSSPLSIYWISLIFKNHRLIWIVNIEVISGAIREVHRPVNLFVIFPRYILTEMILDFFELLYCEE